MQVSPAHHQILYISRLAPGYEVDAFISVCRTARSRHEEMQCAGALLFDGHRFCHLLAGPAPAVRALMGELAADPRYDPPTVLADATIDGASDGFGPRSALSAGYCDVEELDVFEASPALQGVAALAAFRSVLSSADLSP